MKYFLLIIISILLASCGEGLQPPEKSYLRGRVIFQNDSAGWPPPDSLNDLRIIAFKNFPPDDFLIEVLEGRAYFTDETLPFYSDTAEFELDINDAPVLLKYIAVAHQYGSLLEWQAVGVYNETGVDTLHTQVMMELGANEYIEIKADFKKLPPQPF
ncbi:MAG: hypothetical protein ACLFR2_06545 [Candidatus Kapaibacterium sp.]